EPANRGVLDEVSTRHGILLGLVPVGWSDRFHRNAAGEIHAGYPRPDGGSYVVEAETVALGHLARRDLTVALAADDDDLVADLRAGHLRQVDASVLEAGRGHDRRGPPAYQYAAGVERVEPVGRTHRNDAETHRLRHGKRRLLGKPLARRQLFERDDTGNERPERRRER